MAMTIPVNIFDPSSLSDDKRARLESLLNTLDIAVEERKKYQTLGRVEALKEYLADPSANKVAHDYLLMYNAIPTDRWSAMAAVVVKTLEGRPDVIRQFEALDYERQKEAASFTFSQYTRFIDISEDRKHWKKLDGIYETILSEFPSILTSMDDLKGVVRLGQIFAKHKDRVTETWKTASAAEKIETAKSLLAEAYPDDNPEHLYVAPVDIKRAGAAFMGVADIILCGPMMLGGTSSALPIYQFTHEFQHRRQTQLVERLEKNELPPGSAEYYQARLFRANHEGGYLTPMTASNKIAMLAKLTDYLEQPLEAQANGNAKLACAIGDTGGDSIWKVNERFCKAVSAVARPVDKIVHGVSVAVSTVATLGRKAPRP